MVKILRPGPKQVEEESHKQQNIRLVNQDLHSDLLKICPTGKVDPDNMMFTRFLKTSNSELNLLMMKKKK